MHPIAIGNHLNIPVEEVEISFARAGGPGGQNVNKVSTKVFLRWFLSRNNQLTPEVKEKVQIACAPYLTGEGDVLIQSTKFRSQGRNLQDCVAKLQATAAKAFIQQKKRVKTKTPHAVQEGRLEEKKRSGAKKRLRSKVDVEKD